MSTGTASSQGAEDLLYQLRVYLNDEPAALARSMPDDPTLAPLTEVLARHGAVLKCQYDAFAEYVAAADAEGIDKYPLAEWTRATIENPAKKAKYIKSFTIHIGDEVYARDKADALETDLQPLVGGEIVAQMTRHDTNLANNPQMPEQYRPKSRSESG